MRLQAMTRLEEIDAELEILADRLCCAEDLDCGCGAEIRAQMRALHRERDEIPAQR